MKLTKFTYCLYLSFITLLLMSPLVIHAQEENEGSLRDRIARRQQEARANVEQNSSLPQLSVRAQMRNQNNTQSLENATWMREIYRLIDVTKGVNAALYYPVTPIEERMNLYTMIFKLMANGELEAYEFNDSEPIFTEKFKVAPEDMFEKLEIGFSKEGDHIVYDEYSIPSNEILGYYVKEAWYFDQSNSVLDVKTVAICPVLYRNALDGFDVSFSAETATREPQFWIPYENIRPYAARMPIMTSDINNVLTKTIDDYFKLRLYDGEIYKTTNMENKFLIEKYPVPEEAERARENIEEELIKFEEGLWVINDSVKISDGKPVQRDIKQRDMPKNSSSGSSATHSARERRKNF